MKEMKTIGVMDLKQLRELSSQIKNSAPPQAKVIVIEGANSLTIECTKGKVLSAIWQVKSKCHVMAVDGLVKVSH